MGLAKEGQASTRDCTETIWFRNKWAEARKDRVSLLPSALRDTRDQPSTSEARHYLVIKGHQPLPNLVIIAGGLPSH